MMTTEQLVDRRDGALYVKSSRVSLASIIFMFQDGASPESIREGFPSLSLAQIYSAIAFYLSNPEECERYVAEVNRRWDVLARNAKAQLERMAPGSR